MRTAVDTNVLLDLLAGPPEQADAARQAIVGALSSGQVLVSPVTYAELAAAFPTEGEPMQFLGDLQIQVAGFAPAALFEAAAAWRQYTARRGQQVQCARCGHRATLSCTACGAPLVWRQHIIADFLVGGHALRQADQLLTRDVGYYRTYFPALRLAAPQRQDSTAEAPNPSDRPS